MRQLAILFYLLTVIVYAAPYISPDLFWPMAFVALPIPLFLFLHTLLAAFYLFRKDWQKALPSLIFFLVGIPFLKATIGAPWSVVLPAPKEGLSVLSYNVRVFNNYLDLNQDYKESVDLLAWAKADDSDIKCFQEFYHNLTKPILQSKQILSAGGSYHYCDVPFFYDAEKHEFGLAIFSKYPIVACGKIDMESRPTNNGGIFADVVLPGQDTIRIVNVHLESLSLNTSGMENGLLVEEQAIYLGKKLRSGFQQRARQAQALSGFLSKSPYPLILCGDFNDFPQSYTYQQVNNQLSNAHANKGLGFGGTFRGFWDLLRIDHQFYSTHWSVQRFEVLKDVQHTDHYPLKGWYRLKK